MEDQVRPNFDLAIMRKLMRAMLRVKVRPYLIFHCDPVTGAGHFRTSVWKGMEIIEGLRGRGAEGIVLGCTEIPLLVEPKDCALPLFNTALLHAAKALDFALQPAK
jgi:hypothetical protein